MHAEENGEKEKVDRQDLLTFMLEENIGSDQPGWSEDHLLDMWVTWFLLYKSIGLR